MVEWGPDFRALLKKAPILPVITLHRLEDALPLAEALLGGGLPVLEVTLRTECAPEAIAAIRKGVPGATVGAGTVLSSADCAVAKDTGSQFLVSPGVTESLLQAAGEAGLPFLPGIATAGELMQCRQAGLSTVKFFPAEAAGGVAMLRSLAGPFPETCFCPTGGIGPDNLGDYLALPQVLTVGGSWVVPSGLVAQRDWTAIESLAREAATLVRELRAGADGGKHEQ